MKKRPSLIIFTKKHVNLPAMLAGRMQRYSIYLMVVAFVLLGINLAEIPGKQRCGSWRDSVLFLPSSAALRSQFWTLLPGTSSACARNSATQP